MYIIKHQDGWVDLQTGLIYMDNPAGLFIWSLHNPDEGDNSTVKIRGEYAETLRAILNSLVKGE